MKEVVINGAEIADKKALHETLRSELSFPEWYGGNLDALFDCLTDIREETKLVIKDFPALRETLGGYAEKLKKVISAASRENECIVFEKE